MPGTFGGVSLAMAPPKSKVGNNRAVTNMEYSLFIGQIREQPFPPSFFWQRELRSGHPNRVYGRLANLSRLPMSRLAWLRIRDSA